MFLWRNKKNINTFGLKKQNKQKHLYKSYVSGIMFRWTAKTDQTGAIQKMICFHWTYSETCVRQPPLGLTLVVDVERWLSYKGTCHVILLAKLHDMYLYKTATFPHQPFLFKICLKGGSLTQVSLYVSEGTFWHDVFLLLLH